MSLTYLFDTDILIAYLRNYQEAVELIQSLANAGDELAAASITIVEIEAGVRPSEEERTKVLLDSLTIYQLDRPISHLAGNYIRQYRQNVSLT